MEKIFEELFMRHLMTKARFARIIVETEGKGLTNDPHLEDAMELMDKLIDKGQRLIQELENNPESDNVKNRLMRDLMIQIIVNEENIEEIEIGWALAQMDLNDVEKEDEEDIKPEEKNEKK